MPLSQSQPSPQRPGHAQEPKPRRVLSAGYFALRPGDPMIIIRMQAIRGKSVRSVVDCGKMPIEKRIVLLRLNVLPKPLLPARMVRVIMILMNGQYNPCRIHDGHAHRADLPQQPVIVTGPADGERRYSLVQQAARKNKKIDPLRWPEFPALAGQGAQALPPIRL